MSLAIPIVVVLILFDSFLGLKVKQIHWTDAKAANEQVLIQFCIYTTSYILMVLFHWIFYRLSCPQVTVFSLVGMSVISGWSFYRICFKTVEENKIPAIRETAKPILKIVAFSWYGIFGTLCCINYMLVVLFPSSYKMTEVSFAERAFNVVYYTFSVMFTYTGNAISVCDALSRSVEMVEILCCYVIIGIIVTNTIGKAVEKV